MRACGETGAAWEEVNIVPYLLDPTGHLREATGEDGRGRMAYQVRDEEEAHDLWAYLATFAPSDLQAASPAATE
jgi:cytochrome c